MSGSASPGELAGDLKQTWAHDCEAGRSASYSLHNGACLPGRRERSGMACLATAGGCGLAPTSDSGGGGGSHLHITSAHPLKRVGFAPAVPASKLGQVLAR
ncbi:unnamed protein product [Urochloa humidicola]